MQTAWHEHIAPVLNEWMNEWKCSDLKCIRKQTRGRLSLTHLPVQPLSIVKSLGGPRVHVISPVGKEKVYGGKDLLKSQNDSVTSSEWNIERVREDASGDSENSSEENALDDSPLLSRIQAHHDHVQDTDIRISIRRMLVPVINPRLWSSKTLTCYIMDQNTPRWWVVHCCLHRCGTCCRHALHF